MAQYIGSAKAIILKDGTLSNAVDIRDAKFISLILPTLDTCNITFEVSDSKTGNYVDLKKADASAVTITATTGGFATLYIDEIAGYGWMKVKASAAQTTATVEILVILKK